MKRSNTRFISGTIAVLACGLIVPFVLSACKASARNNPESIPPTSADDIQTIDKKTTTDNTFPDQLLDSDQIAFSASVENWGPFNYGYDYWTGTSYVVYYNGTIEIRNTYSLSGEEVETGEISYEDLKEIRTLADSFRENESGYDLDFSDYCDGSGWSFTTYDTDGSKDPLYSGYIYEIDELESIRNILSSYETPVDLNERAFRLFEGKYYCSDYGFEYEYISLYKKDDKYWLEIKPVVMAEPEVYEIREIELMENNIIYFNYVEDNKWHSFIFSFSDDMTQLKPDGSSNTYDKLIENTEETAVETEAEV